MANRSSGRNVHIYGPEDRSEIIGGLRLNRGITKSNLYFMVDILLLFHSAFSIETEAGTTLEKNEEPLIAGNYYVVGRFRALTLVEAIS